jgi:hypothetical protein
MIAMAATAAGLMAFIVFDHLALVELLGFALLDPVRFSAEVYLALVILAGLGLAYLPLWLGGRWQRKGLAAGGLVLVLALAWLAQPVLDMVGRHRDPAHFLDHTRRTYGLDGTWDVLGQEPGRILFTSYYSRVGDVPTALKATTPYFTGRPILGGTFSHWSPVARALWVGSPDAELLPGQVELTDDVSLANRPWSEWTDAGFLDLCQRLNATTVVATWDDINARTFLDGASHFQAFHADDLFVLYRVLGPAPGLVEGEGAEVTLARAAPTALDVRVDGATEGASLRIKITDYPLWQAEAGGEPLAHQADALGLMSLSLPEGSYDLSLRYRPGPAEQAGTWVSLGAIACWLVALALSFRRRAEPVSPGVGGVPG